MVDGVKIMKKQLVLHPYFFAVYSVLGVYSANYKEIPSGQVIRPFFIALLVAALIYFAIYAWKKNAHRSGLLATVIIFACLYSGYVGNYLQQYIGLSNRGWINLALFGFWVVVFLYFNTKRFWGLVSSEEKLSRYLNLTSTIVLIIPVIVYARSVVIENTTPLLKVVNAHAADLPATSSQIERQALPDIYYIILDGYGGNDVLGDIYGYDNSEFTEWLIEHGFYVAQHSRANYMRTPLSLSSTLNMEYFDYLYSEAPVNTSVLRDIMMDSRLEKVLRSHDYTIYSFTSATFFTKLTYADVLLSPYSNTTTEFESYLLSNNAFSVPIQLFDLDISRASYEDQRIVVLYEFETLPKLASTDGPKFVFVHILAPHPPFIFDAQGNFTPSDRPYAIGDASDFEGTAEEYRQGYVQQLQYTNTKVEEAVEGILMNSSRPLIIIIQGDHGPGMYTDFQKFDDTCVRERFSILNAYYFPPEARNPKALEEIHQDISPVNSFRLVLNAYLGAEMEMLPNRYYYTSNTEWINFIQLSPETLESCRILPTNH